MRKGRGISFRDGGLFEVGGRLAAAWTESSSGCAPATPSPESPAYALTPLDPARLAVVVEKTE